MKSKPEAPIGELADLLSQRTAVERMLADTPAEDVLDLAALSARLGVIKGRIYELTRAPRLQR